MQRLAAGLAGLAPLPVLAACSPGGAPTAEAGHARAACALGLGAPFADVCAIERVLERGARVLVVEHPDGGFRLFAIRDDGRALTTADGAEAVQVARAGGMIEVRVNDDRYRLALTGLRDAGS
ncbi:MAG: hypothetical protein V4579_01395 [Pseudomonadota bacterium]